MMKKVIIMTALVVVAASSQAQFSLTKMNSFGGGDGWLTPAESGTVLGTGSLERGFAVNPVNGNVAVASRNGGNKIHILDGTTGALLHTLPTPAGVITGGTFAINMLDYSADGRLYVGNLGTNSTTTSFKLYEYASDLVGTNPTLANSYTAPLATTWAASSRLGDSLDIRGSIAGGDLEVVTSGSGSVGYLRMLNNGSGWTNIAQNNTAASALTNPAFRLSVAFGNGPTLWGRQPGSGNPLHYVNYATPAILGTPTLTAGNNTEMLMDFAKVGAYDLLATMDVATNFVRVWDVTNPLAPSLLGSINSTTSFTANGNNAGSVKFGKVNGNLVTLYGMNTNNGAVAYNIQVVPEPASMMAIGAGLVAMMNRKRRKA